MTEHQDPLVLYGYRELTQRKIDMINEGKILEEKVLRYIDWMETEPGTDLRWLATGRTSIQQGFMAVFRGVLLPTRLDGEL